MTTATARAHPNIAFIKYWGNRDEKLRLPANGSLSMNLAGLETETTVDFNESWDQDEVILGGEVQTGPARDRVVIHLEAVRSRAQTSLCARVESANNFPAGVGIASSASAFAALTVAATVSAGLALGENELSALARLGSGSAATPSPAPVRCRPASWKPSSYWGRRAQRTLFAHNSVGDSPWRQKTCLVKIAN